MSEKQGQNTLSFEQTLTELESIVTQMESGDMPLEAALSSFERGIQLAQSGQEKLKHAEQKVQMLVAKDGEENLVAMNKEDNAPE